MEPHELSAKKALQAIREQRMSSQRLTHSCLARVDAREAQVRAWAHLDYGHAIDQARQADEHQRAGEPLGALHGIPIGVKDIFDTQDYPTEYGSMIFQDRQPQTDSAVVERLRAAGAVIFGKTVTTEFASFHPNKTRNPHDLERTPGGSSSGSAAAVASNMVPLAIGSQTGGSTIRPGSFCGIVAFKPTFGAISRHGCMMLAHSLDHVGLYARTVEDIAILAQTLYGADDRDAASGTVCLDNKPLNIDETPVSATRLAFAPTPFWAQADEVMRHDFSRFLSGLGDLPTVELAAQFAHAPDWLAVLLGYEMSRLFASTYRTDVERMSAVSRADIEFGQGLSKRDYADALEGQSRLRALLDELFENHDVLITPAVLGEAPPLATTGDPIFCSIWTLCGFPCVSLPLLTGPAGLPIGVQLVGRRNADSELLSVAASLQAQFEVQTKAP